MSKQCGIYAIDCTANGKRYIGSSNNFEVRKHRHFTELGKGIHNNAHMQACWNKYGEKTFEFSLLEECVEEELINREQYYLDISKIPLLNKALIAGKPPSPKGKAQTEEQSRGAQNLF